MAALTIFISSESRHGPSGYPLAVGSLDISNNASNISGAAAIRRVLAIRVSCVIGELGEFHTSAMQVPPPRIDMNLASGGPASHGPGVCCVVISAGGKEYDGGKDRRGDHDCDETPSDKRLVSQGVVGAAFAIHLAHQVEVALYILR